MKSFKAFLLEEKKLKFKKVAPKIFKIIGTNAWVDAQSGAGWKLFSGDEEDILALRGSWVETFKKKQEAIDWINDDKARAKDNGIVFA